MSKGLDCSAACYNKLYIFLGSLDSGERVLRNCSRIMALLILLGLIICVPVQVVSVEPVPPVVPASGTFEKYGPRVYDLIFDVPPNPWDIRIQVVNGLIDLPLYPVPEEDWDDWLADPEITMGEIELFAIYFFALNNQMWPIGHGAHEWINYTCPECLDARDFRRALAHLTNKTIWSLPQETFIPPVLQEWENPNVTTYEYDPELARDRLNAAGFNDYDGDGMLEYSPGHAIPTPPDPPADMEELPELQGWIITGSPMRIAAEMLRDELVELGIPQSIVIADRGTCYYHVYILRDYHIYADAWSSRDPSGLYEIFWSEFVSPFLEGSHIGYYSEEFDYWFEKFRVATTMEEALEACYMFQEIVARDVASIPLYAYAGYTAHRTNYGHHAGEGVYEGLKWEGFVNELGVGFPNFWTYLNAHPQGFGKGGTLRQGLIYGVESFNPVHAEWFEDWLVLDEIYEPLIKNHPYSLTEKIIWLCRNWTIGTWEFEGKNCTKIRFKLCPGILWHDLTPFTVEDIAFTFAYMKDEVSIANYWAVANYYGAITTANGSGWWGPQLPPDTIDILYDVESWFALDWIAAVPIIPKHIWQGKDSVTWNPEDHDAVIGTGPFMCRKDGVVGRPDHVSGEYTHLTDNVNYFRKKIWPDVCDAGGNVGRDGVVKIVDFMSVSSYLFTYDPRLYPFLPPWPSEWVVEGENLLDVDENGVIDTDDLLEIGVHFGKPWPPPWYVDC